MRMRTPWRLGIGTALVAGMLAGCGGGQPTSDGGAPAPVVNAPAADPQAGHAEDHSQMPSMVRLQEATGEAFDAAFLGEMVEHH